jgi:hypothetical protein
MRKRAEAPDTSEVHAVHEEKGFDIPEEEARLSSPIDEMMKAEEVPLPEEFETIIRTEFIEKPLEVYKRLEVALRIGDERDDRGTLLKALDEAHMNAREAHRLWTTARIEVAQWEAENAVIHGGMRESAIYALEREKATGRKKMVTEGDLEAFIATNFTDEYKAQARRKAEVKAMAESMKNLAETWASRCRALETMLGKQR